MRLGVTALLTDRTPAPADVARAVEERGFHSLYLPEHTHLPVRADVPPAAVGGVAADDYRRTVDPLVALAAAAAVTQRLVLGTGVVLVAQHDPIILAKQVATLDHMSGGRAVLGVGFGWNRAEAEDHRLAFAERWAVAEDHVRCLRALWSMPCPSHHGPYVDLPPCWSWPKPAQRAGVPVLIGGGASRRVLSAVAAYGDGWLPIGGAGLGSATVELRRLAEEAGRDPAGLRVVPFGTLPTAGKLQHFADLGVDEVVLRVPAGPAGDMLATLDRYVPFLEAFADA